MYLGFVYRTVYFLVKVLLVNLYLIDHALKSSRSGNSELGTFLLSGCFHGKELLAFDNVFASRKNYHPLQEYSSFQARPSIFTLTYNLLSSSKPSSHESCAAFPAQTEMPDNVNTRVCHRHSITVRCRVNKI